MKTVQFERFRVDFMKCHGKQKLTAAQFALIPVEIVEGNEYPGADSNPDTLDVRAVTVAAKLFRSLSNLVISA